MDQIRRKLALIDARRAWGPAYFHKHVISTAPLVFVAIGLIAGILIQNWLELSVWIWLILTVLCLAATVVAFVFGHGIGLHKITAYTALICFGCLGAIRLTSFMQPQPDDIRNFVANERKLATIRGIVITDPYSNKNQNWQFARYQHSDTRSSFYLKIREVQTISGWAKVSGTVRVYVAEPVLDLKAGDYIQAYCCLDRFKGATNPGQFDTAEYLARKNIFVAVSIKSRDGIELLEGGGAGIFTKIKGRLRETATQALLGDLSVEDRSRGLLEALLLGYRGNIDSDTYRAFHKTGLLHFISLSGMHLGILAGIIWWLCKTAGLMKPARAIICIIAICIFLLIVPPRAPTLRAAIICWVFCASFLFRRHANPINTLSLAAIILLLIRPTNIFEVGWQLSFASVLGLLLFCHRIHFFLYEKITGSPWSKKAPLTRPFFRIVSKPGPYLLRLFSTGFTAWLGGAGVLLYHFYTINPLTSIWTIIAFPLVALILTIGYLKIILSLLLPTLSSALGIIVTVLSGWLIEIVKLIADLDISQILIGHVPATLVVFYYCVIVFAAFAYFRRPLIKKAICVVSVLAIIGFLGITKWQRIHRDNLVLTFLDVGHGQAILAKLPGRTNILFDAGSMYNSNIGRKVVTPFLNYSGISRIDSVVISHDDRDHINGIPEIIQNCEVGSMYAHNAFLSKINQRGTAKSLNDFVSKKGLRIQNLGENLNSNSNAKIRILWPTEEICQDMALSDNDKSVVALIQFEDIKILLCSDIEQFSQKGLLQLYPDLKAEIVVVPHHGSAITSGDDFLKKLDANILICSCGRRYYEKYQTAELENSGKSFYTARDGAITVRIGKNGVIKTGTYLKQKK